MCTFSSCSSRLLSNSVCGLLITWGFSCCQPQALGTQASVVAAHGLICPTAHGIFPDQGLNPCLLPQQADSFNHWTTREVQYHTVLITTALWYSLKSRVCSQHQTSLQTFKEQKLFKCALLAVSQLTQAIFGLRPIVFNQLSEGGNDS